MDGCPLHLHSLGCAVPSVSMSSMGGENAAVVLIVGGLPLPSFLAAALVSLALALCFVFANSHWSLRLLLFTSCMYRILMLSLCG